MAKLAGKIAVITGGAMGNGLGIAKVFLNYGAKVIIIDYSNEVFETVESLKEDGRQVIGYQVDVRNKEELTKVIDEVVTIFGHIDILVNNAGVCNLKSFDTMTDEERDYHFDINIKGTWNMTKVCLPYMKNRGAAIVNLSSVTGVMVADAGEVAYATTKAALMGFTKALARELVDDDIRVNAILPGYIKTPMIDKMAELTNKENPNEVIKGIVDAIPMKRMGTIEEVGELAAFLASNEASYITAQGFVIDGASTLPETLTMGI